MADLAFLCANGPDCDVVGCTQDHPEPNPFLDGVDELPMLLGSFEPDDEPEPGVCICGAYGPAGKTHIAKPSADEPPEECGRFL